MSTSVAKVADFRGGCILHRRSGLAIRSSSTYRSNQRLGRARWQTFDGVPYYGE